MAVVVGLIGSLVLASAASGDRAFLPSSANPPVDISAVPGGRIDGACGIAADGNAIYVSDYYNRVVDVFDSIGTYVAQIKTADTANGPCGLAVGDTGNLYVNEFHGPVLRYTPDHFPFTQFDPPSYGAPIEIDPGPATGVAVDPVSGNVYVNRRTHLAVYQPDGEPVLHEGEPLHVGDGSLADAYGVAVSAFPSSAGTVYVADAAENTIEVYRPAIDPLTPAATINGSDTPEGGFSSLVDTALAVDPANGNLLVVDNLQPGFEQPEAAIYEFDPTGAYVGKANRSVIHSEPAGLAVNGNRLYATSGNEEEATVTAFGPFVPPAPGLLAAPVAGSGENEPLTHGGAASSTDTSAAAARSSTERSRAHASEAVQKGRLRVAFDAAFSPRRLPRRGVAPIRLSVGARISSMGGGEPPQLRTISIALNEGGRFEPKGLPVCRLTDIQPATTENALRACRRSLVGDGTFSADVKLGRQSPFPSQGKIHAFNGRIDGKPAILAHVYGREPIPTSYTVPFEVGKQKGTFATVLRASLPEATGDAGHITGLSLNIGKTFRYRGERRSYLSAGCPAPKGFPGTPFPLARAKLGFAGGKSVETTLTRSCRARG